jgi:F-type H+-transporting ATPase subunit epsilon
MSAELLALEVVTPDGMAIQESDVDMVVLRRRERRFDPGSEVAILPRHGPMLVRLTTAPARYLRHGTTSHLALCGGFAEVRHDRVVVVTARCAPVPDTDPDREAAAWKVCDTWSAEAAGSREELAGLARQRFMPAPVAPGSPGAR